jgi:hypothetical protein
MPIVAHLFFYCVGFVCRSLPKPRTSATLERPRLNSPEAL